MVLCSKSELSLSPKHPLKSRRRSMTIVSEEAIMSEYHCLPNFVRSNCIADKYRGLCINLLLMYFALPYQCIHQCTISALLQSILTIAVAQLPPITETCFPSKVFLI